MKKVLGLYCKFYKNELHIANLHAKSAAELYVNTSAALNIYCFNTERINGLSAF
jgi:hypothetical protein